jgi:uncharacterized DUF497 family protein
MLSAACDYCVESSATRANASQCGHWARTSNIVKHGLSPVEGEGVLSDPLGLTVEDDSSAGESRWITVGMNAGGEELVVICTERDDGER